jgi:acid phosphatase type 7
MRLARLGAVTLVAIVVWACGGSTPSESPQSTILGATATPTDPATPSPSASPSPSPSPTDTATPIPSPADSFTLPPTVVPGRPVNVSIVAAGDIACDPAHNVGAPTDCDQAATAALIGRLRPSAVLPLGDLQYQDGTPAAFQKSFGPTWGAYRSIMYPAIGNHEYLTSGAAGYFGFFRGIAPYYSYSLGNWHMVSLDSECQYVGGCQAGSAQESWLRADLAAHANLCTLVYWHEPRWSSGEHQDAKQMATIWADVVAAHVDVVLSGHNHDYERFAPLGATGGVDPTGTTEFVVGTGGKNHYGFVRAPLTGELVRNDTSFGVLRMLLGPTSFSWRFYAAPGYTFSDSGSARCN